MTGWNFYQIPATGVEESNLDVQTRDGVYSPISRASDMKISNFSSLFIGPRRSDDYTKTELYFQTKDTLADWGVINSGDLGTIVDTNPYVLGSTVKRVRDDQFFRMTMDSSNGIDIELPKHDVSDSEVVNIPVADKRYPSEGWRSLGGKYDFMPYDGTLR